MAKLKKLNNQPVASLAPVNTAAATDSSRIGRSHAQLLSVCEMVMAALEVGNGINRHSQPIGGKTYLSQLRAAITNAKKI